MSKKGWSLGILSLVLLVITLGICNANDFLYNDTTYNYTLIYNLSGVYSNTNNITRYYYENTSFYAKYTINETTNQSKKCSILFDDLFFSNMTFDVALGQYVVVKNFSLNGTYNYSVSCEINETLNLTENNSVELKYNFPPTFANISQINLTDYQNITLDISCTDFYNDNLVISLNFSVFNTSSTNESTNISNSTRIIGNIINKTKYNWMPNWYDVNDTPYNITIFCGDGVNVANTTFSILVNPRTVLINMTYPISGYMINKTTDYVYCEANDGYPVGKLYVTYNDETPLFIDNSKVILTTRNYSENGVVPASINISCYSTNINGTIQGKINETFEIDIIPPGITEVVALATYTTATIVWLSNENATTSINYGINNTYFPFNKSVTLFDTNHTITINNLVKNTDYYYYVTSCDAAHLCTKSYIQTIHTNNCLYLFQCGNWGTCLTTNTMIRTCTCVCENACEGNNSMEKGCIYVAPIIVTPEPEIYDTETYYYEKNYEKIVSSKFFNTNTISWNLTNVFAINYISLKLNRTISGARIVLVDNEKNHGKFPPKDNPLIYYEVISSNLERVITSGEIVFEIDKKYEKSNISIAEFKNGKWSEITYQRKNNSKTINITNTTKTTNSDYAMYLNISINELSGGYVIYLNIPQKNVTVEEIEKTVMPRESPNVKKPSQFILWLKKYEINLNILLVIFICIAGLIIIKIIRIYFSYLRHKKKAALGERSEAILIDIEEDSITKFFKKLFR
ncbi:MAG: hypothetical protein WC755_04805 [Candidatus Woesearchaeota archaeon]|jgi:hypothetical protein